MARKSFTLQKLSTEEGSYLQYATNKEATVTSAIYYPLYALGSFTTATPHGFAVGDTVSVAGTTPSSYSTTGTVFSLNGTTGFYFLYFNGNPKSALGTDGSTTFSIASATVVAGDFVAGRGYTILNTTGTTQAQWNTAAGTTGVTYNIGSVFTAATAGEGTGTVSDTGTSVPSAFTATGVIQSYTNGYGTGASFTITKTGTLPVYNSSNTTITVTSGGSNYQVGYVITLPGTSLGSGTATNNLTLRIETKADGLYVSGGNATSKILGLNPRVDASNTLIDDSKLKADGLLVAPILNTPVRSGSLLPYASFFSAEVSDYEEIILTWDAPLNDLALAPTNSTVVATALLISYSEDGEPPTVSDGTVIVYDATSKAYYHKVPSGKWAYYTMFVKFESRDGDLYYEPTAKLAVLTPNKYNSVDDLYKKIPEYYRNLDDNMSTGLGGPLYRYLSIFGFEIDKVRTELDFMISMKDPQLANSEVLDYLAQDLGVDLQSRELGAGRLRNLMNIIGYLRRSEGTIGSLEYAMQAITGSDIEIDTVNKVVKVFAQRVNLLKDPNLDRIIAGLFDGGSPSSSVFSLELDAGVAGTSTFTTTYDGGTPDATGGSTTGDELWNYDPDLSSGGSISVLQTISNYIPVTINDDLYFSVQAGTSSPAQNSITKVALYANAPYGSTSPLPVCVAQSTTPTEVSGTKYWKLSVPSTRTNLCTNPSFETNGSGWGNISGTVIAVTAGTWGSGSDVLQVTCNNATATGTFINNTSFSAYPVTGGLTYTASVYAKHISGTARVANVTYLWSRPTGNTFATGGTSVTLSATPQRLSVTATAPANATGLTIWISIYSSGTTTTADISQWDMLLLEQSTTVNDYFDGSMTSYASWSGTAHLSTSIGGPSLGTYKNMYLAIFQESEIDAQQHFNSMLLERATNGNYFNGNTSFGGWLVDGNTISDYRWYNPAAPNSASAGSAIENFSVYNSNYQKTRAVANRFLTNLLPVTQLTTGTAPVYSNGTVPDPEWDITFNHIPGVTYP
jgi:phage tail-like protein